MSSTKCSVFSDSVNVLGRILLAVLFIWAGYGKITGYDGTAQFMSNMGVPGLFLPLVILLEVGGGIAIVLGFLTKPVAMIIAIFTVVAAIIFHNDWTNGMQLQFFMKDISIAGGFLMLSAYGAGKYSLDNFICQKFFNKKW